MSDELKELFKTIKIHEDFDEFLKEHNIRDEFLYELNRYRHQGALQAAMDSLQEGGPCTDLISAAFSWCGSITNIGWSDMNALWNKHYLKKMCDIPEEESAKYALERTLDEFLTKKGIRHNFIVACLMFRKSRGVDASYTSFLRGASYNAIDEMFLWSNTTEGLSYWSSINDEFQAYFREQGFRDIKINLKPTLDDFLRRKGRRKEFVKLIKASLIGGRLNEDDINRRINSAVGYDCIINSAIFSRTPDEWVKVAKEFNLEDTDNRFALIDKLMPA